MAETRMPREVAEAYDALTAAQDRLTDAQAAYHAIWTAWQSAGLPNPPEEG